MKKVLSFSFGLFSLIFSYSQGNNWKMDGNNNATNSSFIGTTNNEPFVLKANDIEGFRLKPNGELRVASFDNLVDGIVWANQNGVLKKLSFTGSTTDFLSGNGTFLSLSNFTGGWSVISGVTTTNNNVGIGTTIAPEKLTVNGNIVASGSISGTSLNVIDIITSGKEFKVNTSLAMKGIDASDPASRNEITGTNGDLFIQSQSNNSYNTIFNLGNTGKVGFGVTPTTYFHVGQDAKFDAGLNLSGLSATTTGDVLMIDASGKVLRGLSFEEFTEATYLVECRTDNNGNITPFWRNGPWKTYIGGNVCEENIKVGINIENPITNIHVIGNGYLSTGLGIGVLPDLSSMVTINSSTNGQTGLTVTSTSTSSDNYGIKSVIDNDATRGFALHDSRINQDVFRVLGNGEVQAKSVKVSLNIWSDFVFADGYKLMPLNELESYIATNNHLPNIPSEREVLTEGVNLGEMDAKLLQKIEELSLYIIEQQKQIDALKTEMEKLTDK
jgi:hypothetical protein